MSDYTILLIDYDPRTLDLLREPLEAMGYTVAIAKDGDEALAAVRDLKPAKSGAVKGGVVRKVVAKLS